MQHSDKGNKRTQGGTFRKRKDAGQSELAKVTVWPHVLTLLALQTGLVPNWAQGTSYMSVPSRSDPISTDVATISRPHKAIAWNLGRGLTLFEAHAPARIVLDSWCRPPFGLCQGRKFETIRPQQNTRVRAFEQWESEVRVA